MSFILSQVILSTRIFQYFSYNYESSFVKTLLFLIFSRNIICINNMALHNIDTIYKKIIQMDSNLIVTHKLLHSLPCHLLVRLQVLFLLMPLSLRESS